MKTYLSEPITSMLMKDRVAVDENRTCASSPCPKKTAPCWVVPVTWQPVVVVSGVVDVMVGVVDVMVGFVDVMVGVIEVSWGASSSSMMKNESGRRGVTDYVNCTVPVTGKFFVLK